MRSVLACKKNGVFGTVCCFRALCSLSHFRLGAGTEMLHKNILRAIRDGFIFSHTELETCCPFSRWSYFKMVALIQNGG